jgi:hypothetical protein
MILSYKFVVLIEIRIGQILDATEKLIARTYLVFIARVDVLRAVSMITESHVTWCRTFWRTMPLASLAIGLILLEYEGTTFFRNVGNDSPKQATPLPESLNIYRILL